MRTVIGAIIVLAGAILSTGAAIAAHPPTEGYAAFVGVLGFAYIVFGRAAIFWRDKTPQQSSE